MGVSCAGVFAWLFAFITLVAAVTSLAVVADFAVEKGEGGLQWWEAAVIGCASASTLCALLVLAAGCCGRGARLAAGAAWAGAAAHLAMLVAFTVYLVHDWSLASWYGGGHAAAPGSAAADSRLWETSLFAADASAAATTTHNAFDFFGQWAAKWQATYVFGCAVGAATALAAAGCATAAAGDVRRRRVADEAAAPIQRASAAAHKAPSARMEQFEVCPV